MVRLLIYLCAKHILLLRITAILSLYDDQYWLCIGKLSDGNYFVYEAGCSFMGFEPAQNRDAGQSELFIDKSIDNLKLYGLTNEQRTIIENNIDTRFTCFHSPNV